MIRKALALLMLIAPAAVCIAACGDDDPVDKYPSTDAFCAALADTECTKAGPACAVTPEACKNARKTACLTASATASGRTYTSANVGACLTATTTAYNAPTVKANLDARNTACGKVFAGAQTATQSCSGEFDCSGSLICDPRKKRCANKTARKEKDECNNAGDTCDPGLFCDPSGVCNKAKVVGDACNADTPCVDTAFCDTLNGAKCAPLAQTGQPCTLDAQCASTYCNPTAKACGARQFPSETGTCKDFGSP